MDGLYLKDMKVGVRASRWSGKRGNNMAKITSEIVNQYFSEMNLRRSAIFPKIDWIWWNTHYHRDWNAFLESNIELAGM